MPFTFDAPAVDHLGVVSARSLHSLPYMCVCECVCVQVSKGLLALPTSITPTGCKGRRRKGVCGWLGMGTIIDGQHCVSMRKGV
jgi:hypothetical protein